MKRPTRYYLPLLLHLHICRKYGCLFCRRICWSRPFLRLLRDLGPAILFRYQRREFWGLGGLRLLILSFSGRKILLQRWGRIARRRSRGRDKRGPWREQFYHFWSDGGYQGGTWDLRGGRRGQPWGRRWRMRRWGGLTWWLWRPWRSRSWFGCRCLPRGSSPNWPWSFCFLLWRCWVCLFCVTSGKKISNIYWIYWWRTLIYI